MFRLEDGKLLHKSHSGKNTVRGRATHTFPGWVPVITSRPKQLEIIRIAHEGKDTSLEAKSLSAHSGIGTTITEVAKRAWWPKASIDIRLYVRSCEPCQKVNTAVLKSKDPLRPVPPPRENLRQIAVDLITLPESDGYKYAIIAIDYLSKFSHGKALKSKKASEVARFLFEWICLFGCPKIIINDQGREFCNAVADELTNLTGVKQRITSAYNPQANGLVERQNQTVKCSLLKVLRTRIDKWPDILDGVLFAHRVHKQRSTGFSPYYLLFGQDPVVPLDLAVNAATSDDTLLSEEDNEELENDRRQIEEVEINTFIEKYEQREENFDEHDEGFLHQFVENFESFKRKVLSQARENIKIAQEVQKKEYDKRHNRGHKFHVGDKVLTKNMRRDDRKGGWSQDPWVGPYVVTLISKTGHLTLKNLKSGVVLKKTVTARSLKHFVDRPESLEDSRVYDCDTVDVPEVLQKEPPETVTAPHSSNDICKILRLPKETVVSKCGSFDIKVKEIDILASSKWVNDEIINSYFSLVREQYSSVGHIIHAFDSHFYPQYNESYARVQRWTKHVDIFECALLLFPLHLTVHWTLCVVDIRNKEIRYYDSQGSSGDKLMQVILKYLKEEHDSKKKTGFETSSWLSTNATAAIQTNSYDCGIYTCFFARMVSSGGSCSSATPVAISKLRRHMVKEILDGRLHPQEFLNEECKGKVCAVKKSSLDPSSKKLNLNPAGIINLGNTCFLGSCVQLIFHCSKLGLYLNEYQPCLHECNCTTCALAKTLQDYKNNKMIRPASLVQNLNYVMPEHKPLQQEDAGEYMALLLQKLRQEFLAKVAEVDSPNPVDECFQGSLRTEISCSKCSFVSITTNHMFGITVDIVGRSVQDCVNGFTSISKIKNYMCPACKSSVKASKRLTLENEPSALLISLNRFTADGIKISTKIELNSTISMSDKFGDRSTEKVRKLYQLQGAIAHTGSSIDSGHYTCTLKLKNKRFYEFSDDNVRIVQPKAIMEKTNYVLLYTRL